MQWSPWGISCAASKPQPAAWETLPTGRRRLLQNLSHDLDTILHLSGCRWSHARKRRGTRGGQHPEDTATGRSKFERSLDMGLLPTAGWMSGATEAGYEGEDKDKSKEVPSTVKQHLTFTRQEEREQERQLAWVWRDLESQAVAILPKTVRERALALLRRLTDGGYISWRPDMLELIDDGIEHKGTNLVDLARHFVRKHCAEPLMHGSSGPLPSFAKFTVVLRRANASHELVRNRHHWPLI